MPDSPSVAYSPVVTMNFTVAGDVSSFDVEAVRIALLDQFPMAEDVHITVAAASVSVQARIVMTTQDDAQAAVSTLRSTSVAALSASLGITVESVATPAISMQPLPSLAMRPPSPSMPSTPRQPPLAEHSSSALTGDTAATSLAIRLWLPLGLFACFICIAWYGCYRQYLTNTEEAFERQIKQAVEDGKLVRASVLAETEAGSMPPSLSKGSQVSTDVEIEIDKRGEELSPVESKEDAKEGWSLLASARARLQLDERQATIDRRVRTRVERVRKLNRNNRWAAHFAGCADANNDIAPNSVPSWDEPADTALIMDGEPRPAPPWRQSPVRPTSGSPMRAAAARMFGSPGSGFRARTSLDI